MLPVVGDARQDLPRPRQRRAEPDAGQRQRIALVRKALEGRAQAIASVYNAIRAANPDPTLIAILQLDTLAKFADSENTKIVVPFESAALLGAAQTLRSVLDTVPEP